MSTKVVIAQPNRWETYSEDPCDYQYDRAGTTTPPRRVGGAQSPDLFIER
ncbi:hypothetical protein I546_5517 [Mycobacterium kansasii 732]|nr:hypothetical protein I546_5517 [Mycobacterium kansasii 732]